MSELRWILIGFGIALLAGIYLWGRRSGAGTAASQGAGGRMRTEPPLQAHGPPDVSGGDDAGSAADHDRGFDRVSSGSDESMITAARAADPAASVAKPVSQQRTAGANAGGERQAQQDSWRGRFEPTFSDATPTEELPARVDAPITAPTLSSSEAPPPRRIERRKILSVRLSAAPQRLDGAKLLETLQAESLEHGKYDVFHRLHDDGVSIFSIASMVEPGTFDLEKMSEIQYPGVTLFAQLPGPVPGMHALNELVACARRLQQSLGGTLQDDRGVPLTVHRIERLRQEVREFERPAHAGGRGGSASHSAGA